MKKEEKKMSKVLISDAMSSKAEEIINNFDGVTADVNTGLAPDELIKIIGDYEGLAVRSSTKVTKEILDAATKLKVIGRAGTGVDNIDVEECTKRGIIVMNTPGGNTITTGEHAVAMMVALARHIPQATASMREGKWEKKKFEGTELTAKTLGVLGMGNIGKVVAERGLGLKMEVIAFDPFLTEETAEKLGVKLVSQDELFASSDFISIHVPFMKETENLVNKETFKKMKKGVYLINCARGGIVNETDMIWALDEGIVAGAAFDVFSVEPPPADLPLLQRPEVILTPHLGASTEDAQVNVALAVADQIGDLLTTGTVRNALNAPSVPGELLKVLTPYIKLGEKLGSFKGQILSEGIEELTIEYYGEVTKHDVAPVTTAVIRGILSTQMDKDSVNDVNAPSIAKERGIKVNEVKSSESTDFVSAIKISVKTATGVGLVEGALFGTEPRIVRINDFFIDAVPEGTLLVLHNEDKTGTIGRVSTALGEQNVNIARLHLGRSDKGGEAVSVWNVDGDLSDDLIGELNKQENIISAKAVSL